MIYFASNGSGRWLKVISHPQLQSHLRFVWKKCNTLNSSIMPQEIPFQDGNNALKELGQEMLVQLSTLKGSRVRWPPTPQGQHGHVGDNQIGLSGGFLNPWKIVRYNWYNHPSKILNGTKSQRTPKEVAIELLDTPVFSGSVQWVLLEISWKPQKNTKNLSWSTWFRPSSTESSWFCVA